MEKDDCINEAFKKARKQEIIEWLKLNYFMVGMILLPVIILIIGVIVASEEKEYEGSIQGIVIKVNYQPKDIIGPELNRLVIIELNNGDTHIANNDTLNVGDEVTAGILVSKKNRYSYYIKRN